jgi:hypothetical protein
VWLWQHEKKFVVTVQKKIYTKLCLKPPTKPSKWFNLFSLADCIYKTKSPGKRPDTKSKVAEAPANFISRSRKLTRQAACK